MDPWVGIQCCRCSSSSLPRTKEKHAGQVLANTTLNKAEVHVHTAAYAMPQHTDIERPQPLRLTVYPNVWENVRVVWMSDGDRNSVLVWAGPGGWVVGNCSRAGLETHLDQGHPGAVQCHLAEPEKWCWCTKSLDSSSGPCDVRDRAWDPRSSHDEGCACLPSSSHSDEPGTSDRRGVACRLFLK